MPLETGDFITDLVPTNPLGTDPKSEGDDHLRLLKKTVQQSFPMIDAAVDATSRELNDMLAEFLLPSVVEIRTVQSSRMEDGAYQLSDSVVIPIDNTIPQITEGYEFLSLAHTPLKIGNTLQIRANLNLAGASSTPQLTAALFVAGTNDALAATFLLHLSATVGDTVALYAAYPVTELTEHVFTVRAGRNDGGFSTMNAFQNAPLYGGVYLSSLEIIEQEAIGP